MYMFRSIGKQYGEIGESAESIMKIIGTAKLLFKPCSMGSELDKRRLGIEQLLAVCCERNAPPSV